MQDFFDMGGYAAYVWTAYGISAFVLALLSYSIWRRSKNLAKRLEHTEGPDKS